MITLDDVSVSFAEQQVLQNLSLVLNEKRIGIIGANGSGKSTFLRLLNGLQLPTSGHVLVDGIDTERNGKAIRRKVGFVFQNPDNQIVMPTVEEDLAFGLKNLKLDKQETIARIDTILKRFHLQEYRNHPSHLLSGGQKQLMAICGVLVMHPEVIVFDEPTTQLDLRNKRMIMTTVKALDEQVIMASHDLPFLESFDRILVFENGRIICDNYPAVSIAFYLDFMKK